MTRRGLALITALVLTGAAATSAWAEETTTLNPDLMTVSGRFGFPKGTGRLTDTRLKLGELTIDPAVAAALGVDAVSFKAIYAHALAKSLTNYGHMAPADATTPVIIDVTLKSESYEIKDGNSIARISVTLHATGADAAADAALAGCVNTTATGEFKALRRERQADGRRALGIFMMVIDPLYAGGFLVSEMHDANNIDMAYNANRTLSQGEGITPDNDVETTQRFAYLNAVQLADINLLNYLGSSAACAATPSVAAAPVPAPAVAGSTPDTPPPAAPAPTPPPASPSPQN